MKLGFIGMSHLGIVSAISAAQKGFQTLAFDVNLNLIRLLIQGKFPISEPDLDHFYKDSLPRIEFTSDFSRISECDIVYISLDVKTSDDGTSDLTEVRALIETVTRYLQKNSCMVILCQVPPGFTRKITSLTSSQVYHQVETLVLGRAFERALNPERIIIGAKNNDDKLNQSLHKFLLSFHCDIIEMDFESSEFCKICINILLASSVTAANTLAEMCEHIGASWPNIEKALRMDGRIGPKAYISAGLGISGGNIERDLKTSRELSLSRNVDVSFFEVIRLNSKRRKLWPSERLKEVLLGNLNESTIAIWGIAYKSKTRSTKNSPSLENILNLPINVQFNLHDVLVNDVPGLSDRNLVWFDNKYEALDGADALMILTDWDEYSNVSINEILSRLKNPIIVDPFGMIKHELPRGVKYFVLGKTPLTPGQSIDS